MSTSFMIKICLPFVFLSIFLSTSVFAEVITRDALMDQIKAGIPDEVCKQAFSNPVIAKAQTEHGMTFDDCKQKVLPISDDCFNKYKNSLPPSLDSANPSDKEILQKTMREAGVCVADGYIKLLK